MEDLLHWTYRGHVETVVKGFGQVCALYNRYSDRSFDPGEENCDFAPGIEMDGI